MAGSVVFALYGLAAGLLFRSEGAVGAASGLLVVFAFLGNVFMPLSGALLEFARFTPLYGIVGLARYPITEAGWFPWTVPQNRTACGCCSPTWACGPRSSPPSPCSPRGKRRPANEHTDD
ncbi:hypothetical protein [Kocuria atrinae]|uniref:hypothetical protein n=1 Tax=Kocuria atrinae TaxID=592377 RepID=UPI002941F218|nr:hypothetical protein [Kocuria atrinae]